MSMAAHIDSRKIICGVNSSEESLKSGENQNCRLFGIKDGKYVYTSCCNDEWLTIILSGCHL